MPLLLDPFIVEPILRGIVGTARSVAVRWGVFIDELVAAFPNPLSMLDAVVGVSTSLPGLVVSLPAVGFRDTLIAKLRKTSTHAKLMRVDSAVTAMFDAQASLMKLFTNTGEQGVAQYIATVAGLFVWHSIKRFKFLRLIFKAQSEREIIDLFVKRWMKATVLRITFLAVGALLLFLSLIGFNFFLIGLSQTLVSGEFFSKILPQNSSRRWQKKSGQFRV